MDINNFVIFNNDFPEGLVEELNNSYEELLLGCQDSVDPGSTTQRESSRSQPETDSLKARTDPPMPAFSEAPSEDRPSDDATLPQLRNSSARYTEKDEEPMRPVQHSSSRGGPFVTTSAARRGSHIRENRSGSPRVVRNSAPLYMTEDSSYVPPPRTGPQAYQTRTSQSQAPVNAPASPARINPMTAKDAAVADAQGARAQADVQSERVPSKRLRQRALFCPRVPEAGMLFLLALVIIASVVLGLVVRRQDMLAQEATQLLDSKIAELHRLLSAHIPDAELKARDEATQVNAKPHGETKERDLPSNLALVSQGARILSGYTTPPASAGWWWWSRAFRVDPDCMLRAPSAECWPVHGEATIAVGLARQADIYTVRLSFAGPAHDPPTFDAYIISTGGSIVHARHKVAGSEFDLVDAKNVTQIMLRLSDFDDLCVRTVELIGHVL